jgi:shikimate kinase
VDQQLARTRKGRERPLLESGDPRETLEALMIARDPLYRKIADIIVETDSREVRAVAKEIEEKLAQLDGGGS